MKRTTLSQIFAFVVIALFSSNINAATYTTMNNGLWNDVINVWSTDGGATPCGCTPGNFSSGNDIVVNHDIVPTYRININAGSVFTINAGASVTSGFDFSTWNSTNHFYGDATFNKFYLEVSGTIDLHTGSVVIVNNQAIIKAGTITLDGAVINSGGLDIRAAATMTLTNSARYLVTSGNATNDGWLNIGPASCMASNGNWKNNASGTVAGSGSLNSGGNLQNSGTFDVLISWCATGAGLGLPTAEDCATSDAICNAITLPVELTSFTADAIDKEYIELNWETASENNSSHFIILSSQDGKNWEEVGSEFAAGNSTETNYYSFEDYNVNYGVTYYKLIQYDFDNRSFESDVISVYVEGEDVEIGVYPNPVKNFETLTITNIEESAGSIHILNISGQIISSHKIDGNMPTVTIQISDLLPGIYFVNVDQLGKFKTKRLVITE